MHEKDDAMTYQRMAYQRIGVIGGGAWGAALGETACKAGREVLLWAYEIETVEEINHEHTNHVYLPGVKLSPALRASADIEDVANVDAVLFVTPSQHLREVAEAFSPYLRPGTPAVVCTKGFEDTGKTMTEVLAEAAPQTRAAVLSGPSFASEVARDLPAAVTLACPDRALGEALAASLGHKTFRLYWTSDLRGAQVGGTVKNVLAIAAGIVQGKKLGASAHAALTTRGFAELVRFGMAMGARFETLTGLSGLGDLILTCSSSQSRNMSLGQALGQGKTLKEILGARKSVSEGVHSAAAVIKIAQELNIEMPICAAVHSIVSGRASVDEAIDALLSRPLRPEVDAPFTMFA
jgi:glycerol-3-phosphate dehydrogenase (NAD(P)+)